MIDYQLNEENFLVYAMNHFEAPTCLEVEEFNEEVKRFRYISRAFKMGNLNIRLILNHIIILHNVFGLAAAKMLLFKVEKSEWKYLVPFLMYLNLLSLEQIDEIRSLTEFDETIMEELRNL